MKRLIKSLAIVMVIALTVTCVLNVNAKTKPKLNKKKVSIYVGNTVKLKMKNTKKKVKWSSSKKSVATVSKKGVVKGKKAGKATITAKIGKKRWTCKVTVKKKPSLPPTPPLNISLKNPLPYAGMELGGDITYRYEISSADIRYAYNRNTNDYLVGIYLSGKATRAKNTKLAIGWQLLNSNSSVIDSGMVLTPNLYTGDTFADAFSVISTNLAPGTYYVELYNYRW